MMTMMMMMIYISFQSVLYPVPCSQEADQSGLKLRTETSNMSSSSCLKILPSKFVFLSPHPQAFKAQAVSQLRVSLRWLTVSVHSNELHSREAFMLLCWVVRVWPFHLFPLIWKSLRPRSPFIWHTARPPVNTHMQSCTLSAPGPFLKVSLTTSV